MDNKFQTFGYWQHIIIVLIGALLLALGLAVMIAWVYKIVPIIQVTEKSVPIMFNSGLCFFITGIAFLVYGMTFRFKKMFTKLMASILLIIASLTLIEYIFNINLEIDQLFVNDWFYNYGPHLGRMSGLTSTIFMLAAIVFFLSDTKSTIAAATQKGAIYLIFLICSLSVIGYALDVEHFLNLYSYTRMPIQTSMGGLILSLGLFQMHNLQFPSSDIKESAPNRVTLRAALILITIALISGFVGFSMLGTQYAKLAESALAESRDNKINLFLTEVERPIKELLALTSHQSFLNTFSKSQEKTIGQALMSEGFTGYKVYRKNKLVESAGTFVIPKIVIPIKLELPAKLIWNKGLFVDLEYSINKSNEVNTIVVEWPLKIAGILLNSRLGNTGEIRICTKLNPQSAKCLPSAFNSNPITSLHINKTAIPMEYALQGNKGVIEAVDYRAAHVLGAYGPIGNTGLGIVAKINSSELFLPIRQKLYAVLPVILSMILIGLSLIYWRIKPLVKALLDSNHLVELSNKHLQNSEVKFRTVIENVSDGLITINDKGVVESLNPAAAKIFGYKENEVIDRNITMLMPPEFRDKHLHGLHRFLTTGEAHVVGKGAVELKGLHKNQSIFPLELSISEFKINDERFFSGIIRDITDRKRIDLMKNEFISVVSHELRTPLTSIKGSLGLLLGGVVGELSAEARKLLVIAENNCSRLVRLINDILDIEKIESGKMEFTLKPVAIKSIIEDSLHATKPFADKFDVKLHAINNDSDILVNGDPDKLLQVMTNLISNAVKFSPPHSEVIIKTELDSDKARVEVWDQGSGIPENFKKTIFQKFAQADSSTVRIHEGTGLGLSISKAIIEKMGGRIGFESNNGQGAKFYFELPLISSLLHPASLPRIENTILLCANDKNIIANLKQLMGDHQLKAKVATNIDIVKNVLSRDNISAIIIDLKMSNSFEFISEIKNLKMGVKIPIIVIALDDKATNQVQGNSFVIIDWLTKPLSRERITQAFNNLLEYLNKQNPMILHVEDDPDIALILSKMLGDGSNLTSVETLAKAKEKLATMTFDLVILDIMLPDGYGFELLSELSERKIPVIIFSAYDLPENYYEYVADHLVKSKTTNQQLINVVKEAIEPQHKRESL
ncbi:MAG: PAS domain S-box protein [Gammaproteobacteria bacterium]|nr:PAS domain S-box protein [Gammaproteobacteria bacterium]